jgi:hypothetical protein
MTGRSKVQKERVAQGEAAIEQLLAAIKPERPQGMCFTSCPLPDGETVVHRLELAEGVDNPWPGIAAAEEFRANLKNWVVGPPIREALAVVGSYRSIREATRAEPRNPDARMDGRQVAASKRPNGRFSSQASGCAACYATFSRAQRV